MKKLVIICFFANLFLPTINSQNHILTKVWETDTVFFMSESAVYDSSRGFIYISNFNFKEIGEKDFTVFNECISRIDIDGKIHNIRWIDSLLGPTGITI